MFVIWRTDDKNIYKETSLHKLTHDGVYRWSPKDFNMMAEMGANIEFNIYFEPGLHWITVSIGIINLMGKTNYELQFKDSDRNGIIYFSYDLSRKYDGEYQGLLYKISVDHIMITLKHQKTILEHFNNTENHKISLMLKIDQREDEDKSMYIRKIFLSRAQDIKTTKYYGTRTYKWLSTECKLDFDEIPLRRPSDLTDMDMIFKSPILSPRTPEKYVPDNDRFSNENRALPIKLLIGQTLTVQIYNLKFNPPKCVEVKVKWGNLVESRSRRNSFMQKVKKSSSSKLLEESKIYECKMNDFLSLSIKYMQINVSEIKFIEFIFIAHKYITSLAYMGENLNPQTV